MSETPHLDAERLAALMDGALSRAERAAAERHAADCGECLQLLAAMARTEPTLPRQGWLPAIAKWGVPIAAAATAVALWLNVDRRQMQPAPAALETKATDPSSRPTETVPAPTVPSRPVETSEAPRLTRSDREADKQSAPREAAQQTSRQETAREAARDRAKFADQLSAQAPPPPAAALPAGQSTRAPASTPAPASQPSLPVVAPLLPASADERRFSIARQADVAPVEFASPDPLVRWRVQGVTVSRSTDGGKTWTSPVVAFPGAVRSGTSPSPQVAWAIGAQGLVMRTTDGVSWTRAEVPAPSDLVSVRAQNALEAEVTAVDGRVFRTTDGGRTWILQEISPSSF